LLSHELLEDGRALVVKAVELGAEASSNEGGVGSLVGIQDFTGSLVLHGFGMDVVGIVAVEEQELGVAGAGGDDKATSLVGEDLSSGFHTGSVAEVCGGVVGIRSREGIQVGIAGGISETRGRRHLLGRTGVLPGLVEMAFGHGNRPGGVFG